MTQSPEQATLEFLLREFLSEQKRLAQQGITLETVYHQQHELRDQQHGLRSAIDKVITDQIAHGMRMDRYGRDIRQLERKTGGHTHDPLEDSGIFREEEARRAIELAELRRRVDDTAKELEVARQDKKNSGIWWKQQKALFWFAVALAIFSAFLAVGGGLFLWIVTHKT